MQYAGPAAQIQSSISAYPFKLTRGNTQAAATGCTANQAGKRIGIRSSPSGTRRQTPEHRWPRSKKGTPSVPFSVGQRPATHSSLAPEICTSSFQCPTLRLYSASSFSGLLSATGS